MACKMANNSSKERDKRQRQIPDMPIYVPNGNIVFHGQPTAKNYLNNDYVVFIGFLGHPNFNLILEGSLSYYHENFTKISKI
jgi:hypothetical protein